MAMKLKEGWRESYTQLELSEKTVQGLFKPVFEEGKAYRTRDGGKRRVGPRRTAGSKQFLVYDVVTNECTGSRYENGMIDGSGLQSVCDLLPGAIEEEKGVINCGSKIEKAIFHCGRCGVIWSGEHACTVKVPPEDPSSKRDREHLSEKPLAKRFDPFEGFLGAGDWSYMGQTIPEADRAGAFGRSANLDPKGLWK